MDKRMDGQMSARPGYSDSNKRFENIHKDGSRDRNRGTNDQGHKFLTRTGCIVVHPKLERKAKTSESYGIKSNGHNGSNNHYGHSQLPFDKGLNRLRMYGIMYQ